MDTSPESWIDPANCMGFALVLPLQAKLDANRGKEELPTHIKQPKPTKPIELVNGHYDAKQYTVT